MIISKFKNFIQNELNKRGYSIVNTSKSTIIKKEFIYMLLFSIRQKKIKIIQIGANDGKLSDPLNAFNNDDNKYYNRVHYLGIEPQKIPFNELMKTYRGFKNFNFIQAAVGKKGKYKFYCFNNKYLDYCKNNGITYTYGLNSLLKENLSKRLIKKNLNPDDYITSYEIDVDTLYNILNKNNYDLDAYKNIDLLQIDAEGYDDQVIYNTDLDFFRPKYINFEYKNLNKTKLDTLMKFLNQNSYECLIYKKNDCLAVLREK